MTITLDRPASWMARAACLGQDPELFFPSESDDTRAEAALAICATCPVQAECAAYARQLKVSDGVWGGTTKGRKRTTPTNHKRRACGTMAAYRRHKRAGEPACDACEEAQRTYMERFRTRIAGTPRCQKLTEDQVRAIRAAHALGQSARTLALRYDISHSQISKIIRREAWVNV